MLSRVPVHNSGSTKMAIAWQERYLFAEKTSKTSKLAASALQHVVRWRGRRHTFALQIEQLQSEQRAKPAPVLCENEQRAKLLCIFKHETSVV